MIIREAYAELLRLRIAVYDAELRWLKQNADNLYSKASKDLHSPIPRDAIPVSRVRDPMASGRSRKT